MRLATSVTTLLACSAALAGATSAGQRDLGGETLAPGDGWASFSTGTYLYRIKKVESYGYSWGVGIRSAIYAESNFFQVDQDVSADELLERFNGTAIHEQGNLFDGPADRFLLDLRDAYNAANEPDLAELEETPMAWTPALFLHIEPARHVLPSVQSHAGPFPW